MGNCSSNCASNFASGFVVNHDNGRMISYRYGDATFEWCDGNRIHIWVHNGRGGLRSGGYGYFVRHFIG